MRYLGATTTSVRSLLNFSLQQIIIDVLKPLPTVLSNQQKRPFTNTKKVVFLLRLNMSVFIIFGDH